MVEAGRNASLKCIPASAPDPVLIEPCTRAVDLLAAADTPTPVAAHAATAAVQLILRSALGAGALVGAARPLVPGVHAPAPALGVALRLVLERVRLQPELAPAGEQLPELGRVLGVPQVHARAVAAAVQLVHKDAGAPVAHEEDAAPHLRLGALLRREGVGAADHQDHQELEVGAPVSLDGLEEPQALSFPRVATSSAHAELVPGALQRLAGWAEVRQDQELSAGRQHDLAETPHPSDKGSSMPRPRIMMREDCTTVQHLGVDPMPDLVARLLQEAHVQKVGEVIPQAMPDHLRIGVDPVEGTTVVASAELLEALSHEAPRPQRHHVADRLYVEFVCMPPLMPVAAHRADWVGLPPLGIRRHPQRRRRHLRRRSMPRRLPNHPHVVMLEVIPEVPRHGARSQRSAD
mmetsp:Transcript_25411/g.72805  ORF Transcript_25411/g.72805 Transcript_25411/m.72805 type:complete len:406 (+) Transcript_25411:200-1417(+)